jgi:hypothetical protein
MHTGVDGPYDASAVGMTVRAVPVAQRQIIKALGVHGVAIDEMVVRR